jgi:carboxylesterase type B
MATNPIIRLTNKASLSGMNAFARNCAKPVKAFLGIPYAEPPERFAPPKPLFQLWNGTKAATKLGQLSLHSNVLLIFFLNRPAA